MGLVYSYFQKILIDCKSNSDHILYASQKKK